MGTKGGDKVEAVLSENVARGHGMAQALDLPLHELITKSRAINIGCNFMHRLCIM